MLRHGAKALEEIGRHTRREPVMLQTKAVQLLISGLGNLKLTLI